MTRIAIHEAGHGCIALREGLPLQYLTIERDRDALGHAWFQRRFSEIDVEKAILTLLAGAAAETQYARRSGVVLIESYSSHDEEMANTLIACACDCSLNHWSPERFQAMREWRRRAADAVRDEWSWIERTAEALLWHGHLSAAEILDLRGVPLPGARVAEIPREASEPVLGEAHAGAISKDCGVSKDGRISKSAGQIAAFEIRASSLGAGRP